MRINPEYFKRSYRALLSVSLLVFVAAAQANPMAGADWYVQINLDQIRQSRVSAPLYEWLQKDVVFELEEELGMEFGDQIRGLTVFGSGLDQADIDQVAVVIEGELSPAVKERAIALVEDESKLQVRRAAGVDYYQIDGPDRSSKRHEISTHLRNGAFVGFGPDQTLITPNEPLMLDFLSAGSQIDTRPSDQLLVIHADFAMLQAGLNARSSGDRGGAPWDSDFFRNVEQAALVISEQGNEVQLVAELTARTAPIAEAMREIAQGLIALGLMENDSDFGPLLKQVAVETVDNRLRLTISAPPEDLVRFLD